MNLNKRSIGLILLLMLLVSLVGCKAKEAELSDISGLDGEVDPKIGYINLGEMDGVELKKYADIRGDLVYEDDEFEVLDNSRSYLETEDSSDSYTLVLKGEPDPEDIVEFMSSIEELLELGNGKSVDRLKVVTDPLMHYMNMDPTIDFGDLAHRITIPNSDDVYYRVYVKDWGMIYEEEDLEIIKKYTEELKSGEAFAVEGSDNKALERIVKWMTEANKETLLYNATQGHWVKRADEVED